MKPCILLAIVLVTFGCMAQRESDADGHFKWNGLINEVSSEYQILGLSIAIIHRDSKAYTLDFGRNGEEAVRRISDTTLFSAQSVSKSFTALACLSAVKEGILDLDIPVINYLPDLRVNSIHEENAVSRITLRHLLSHRSGLPPDVPSGNNFSSEFKGEVYAPLGQRINSLDQVWLRSKVGEQYDYSNVAFDLVARIIEVTSGTSFHEYVRLRVLAPIGMEYSTFDLGEVRHRSDVARGHCNGYDGIVPVMFSSVGGGGLYTCSRDMLLFLESAVNGFPEILNEDLYSEFTSIPFSREGNGYALGLAVNDVQYCTPVFGHTGNGFGFTSLMQWIPDHDMGIAILCNQESAYNGIQRISQAVVSEYGPKSPSGSPCLDLSKYSLQVHEEDRDYFRQIAGDYSNGNVTLTFELRDSVFGVLAPDDGSFNTIHFVTQHSWIIEDEEVIQFTYENGRIVNQNNGMTFVKRTPLPSELNSIDPGWEKYVGRYRSYAYGVLESIEFISMEDGILRLNGNPLEEHEPGLFFDQFGQVVDFRSGGVQIEYGDYIKVD